jgi:hypothetical protein
MLVITLGAPTIPPGKAIYDAIAPTTEEEVVGVNATTLSIAVFNGVIYGVIVWLIYSLYVWQKKKTPTVAKTEEVKPDTQGDKPAT